MSLSYEENKCRNYWIELLETLAEAEEDINAGRVTPMEDTFASLRAIIKEETSNS